MNEEEKSVYILIGEIKAGQTALEKDLLEIKQDVRESKEFLTKWKIGFSVLIGLATLATAVISIWDQLVSAYAWVTTLRH